LKLGGVSPTSLTGDGTASFGAARLSDARQKCDDRSTAALFGHGGERTWR
jgi:hypothetical protein